MSTHGLQWFPDCVNADSLAALRNDWKADFIRLSMYVQEGGYETDPAGFTAKVNGLVDRPPRRGLYALIDFHILTPGDPNFNLDRAKTFFAAVSAEHAAKNNVIYEIANEPNGVSWDAIKTYADQVIPVIRENAPDSVVLVGTRGFSSLGLTDGADETEILDDPVDFANVMYTFHFYAASHGEDRRAVVARAAKSLPLFVSEFGTQTFTGDGTNDLASTTAWLDLLKSQQDRVRDVELLGRPGNQLGLQAGHLRGYGVRGQGRADRVGPVHPQPDPHRRGQPQLRTTGRGAASGHRTRPAPGPITGPKATATPSASRAFQYSTCSAITARSPRRSCPRRSVGRGATAAGMRRSRCSPP